MGLMFIGTLVFNLIPGQMLRVFTSDPQVIAIGTVGFHFVGISFIPMVTSLIFPVFFQAVGAAVKSSLLTVVRTVVLFVPLGYLFSRLGLNDFWFTFPGDGSHHHAGRGVLLPAVYGTTEVKSTDCI